MALFRVQHDQYFTIFLYFADFCPEFLDEWNENKVWKGGEYFPQSTG